MGSDPVVFHRERFRKQSVAKSARAQAWNDASLLQRMADSPVSACEAVIRSIQRGVLDREMREQITKLREQMAQLEQGRPIDV